MAAGSRVAERYLRAQAEALEPLIDQVVDQLLNALARKDVFTDQAVSQALLEKGIDHSTLAALTSPRVASEPLIKALGGLVHRGLWYLLARPFKLLAKIFRSAAFRQEIKATVRRAVRKEFRDTRHMLDVAGRWQRGEPLHPKEAQAAKAQLLRLAAKAILIYCTLGPASGLFSGSLWKSLRRFAGPAEEILVLLLDRPLSALIHKLSTTPV